MDNRQLRNLGVESFKALHVLLTVNVARSRELDEVVVRDVAALTILKVHQNSKHGVVDRVIVYEQAVRA